MANYREEARKAASKYGLDPDIFERQIGAESNFNPKARSGAGAVGIAQIMPGTAKSWGVDPTDPLASLDAAAKNMAQYVRKYGGYENALRAYNAGPGAIEKSKGYRETNAYVAKILNGKTPKAGPAPDAPDPVVSTERGPDTFDAAGYDRALKKAALAQYLQRRNPKSVLLTSGILTTNAPDRAAFTKQGDLSIKVEAGAVKTDSPKSSQDSGDGFRGSRVLEQFHDPVGGRDEGKEIGAIGGHGGHVHVAAGPKTLKVFSQWAQDDGLKITSTTGGKHTPGSYHYAGKAIDVAGDPKAMRRFYDKVKRYDERVRG